MKYLIIYTHPNPKSFNHAIKEKAVERLRSEGHEVSVRDIYQTGFSPVLRANDFEDLSKHTVSEDIRKEQDFIRAADVLIFVHPIWWFGMPALLKGYIDRVFSRGFAYDVVNGAIKGLLTGKKVIILNTTGGDEATYDKMGYTGSIRTTIEAGIFAFCGLSVVLHKYFYAVPYSTDEKRKQMLTEINSLSF